VNIISDFYGGKVQNMDFINSSESSRKEINSWVENQTESKIKDLLSKGSVNSMTRLVLTNAIYFKGDWKEAFSEDCTYKDSFFLSNGDRTEVDMMCMGDKNKKFNYFEEDDLQVIELPYKGEDISMMILLPKQGNLKELEGNITPESLERYRNEMQREKVKIFLPSFKLETQYSMSQDLADMGMPKAFTPDAEFTGMSEASGDKLFISNIIHKAFVELDEVGTEAAAATGVTMEITAMPTQTVPIFDADHPFIFMIQDGDTGNVLFMGKLENPNT
jgi:serpin B